MSNSCCSLRYGKLGCRRYAWRKLSVPYTGVVNPTAFIADRKTKNGKIGIIGTPQPFRATATSSVLKSLIRNTRFMSSMSAFCSACWKRFHLSWHQIVRLVIRRYLSELKETGVDTLILGCTHYPLLRDAIADFMGDGVTLVDSGYETAIYCSKILRENNLLNTDGVHQTPEFYVSDTPTDLKALQDCFSAEIGAYCYTNWHWQY